MSSITSLQLTPFGGPIQYDNILHPSARAIVFLDGVQSSGVTPGSTLSAFMQGYGDVVRVQYPESIGFNGKKAARQILEFIQHYRQVVFVGVSLGGLLAYDIIALAKRRGLKIDFRLGLISAPTGLTDLKDPNAKWARFIPGFPLPRIVSRKLLFKGPFPDFDPSIDEAEKEELDWHENNSREYPFGPWIRQVAFIARHPALDEEVLDRVVTVYVRTQSDPYVRVRRAHINWGAAYWNGSLPEIVVPVDGHCNMLAYPREWEAGLKEMFEELDVKPLI